MSIVYTYTTLRASIQSYAEDTDPDFTDNLDDFIAKAESRVLRDLDLETFEQWLDVTISGANRNVAKPADTVVVNDLWFRDPSAQKWTECPRRSFEYCLRYSPTESVVGAPKFYSEFDEDDLYVVPTPDQSYSGGNAKVRVTIRPTQLSGSNESTWISDNVGDMLFDACMIEAHTFLKNGPKMKEAATKYQSLLPGIAREIEQIVRKKYKELNAPKAQEGADD